jgi:hypothetical protein
MIIKYMTFSFAFTSRAGQAAVDGYCKFWVHHGHLKIIRSSSQSNTLKNQQLELLVSLEEQVV